MNEEDKKKTWRKKLVKKQHQRRSEEEFEPNRLIIFSCETVAGTGKKESHTYNAHSSNEMNKKTTKSEEKSLRNSKKKIAPNVA